MKITLVRHGQTEENYLGSIQGRSNNFLNETGRRQCHKLRAKLKDEKFDVCFMSPLIRTVETAMILIGDRVEMIPDKRLIERNMGNLEGKPRDTYDAKRYWDFSLNCSDEGVESINDIFDRCNDFLDYLYKQYNGKNILIVSHGAPVRAIRHILLGDKDTNMDTLTIENCFCETFDVLDK